MNKSFLFATRSDAKVRELRPIMQVLGYDVRSLRDIGVAELREEESIEAFDTFELNALAKARSFLRFSDGSPVLADDSGLEVQALGGLPGVRSKRWSGRDDLVGHALDEANSAFLLHKLSAIPPDAPSTGHIARYVCAAACIWDCGEIVVRGVTSGAIISKRRGSGGFGYDPYFLSDDLGATFGEVNEAQKAEISHRGRAFRLLTEQLQASREFRGFGG